MAKNNTPRIRTERFTVLLTPAERERLQAWADEQRIKHLGEAARRLMDLSLSASEISCEPKQLCEAAE